MRRSIFVVALAILVIIQSNVLAKSVLWDISHGTSSNVDIHTEYSELEGLLAGEGISLSTTSTGVLNETLDNFDTLVLSAKTTGTIDTYAYTNEEIDAITDFVFNGGGLLIMGDDNRSTVPSNLTIDPIANKFGVQIGWKGISNSQSNTSTSFAIDPIFDNVSKLFFLNAGENLLVDGDLADSSALAWVDTGEALITSATYEQGRVLTIGDADLFWGPIIEEPDNGQFSINVFNYLTSRPEHVVPEPATIAMLGFGAVALLRTRRK
jgi:hypothetical protein